MTSLAILPPLKKTITDLMDEDLYLMPVAQTPAAEYQLLRLNTSILSSPAMNTSNTLSKLLNIPDSFVENYNKVNGSNNNLSNIPSLSLESTEDYNSYESTDAPKPANLLNTYTNFESWNSAPQNSAYVLPLVVQPPAAQFKNSIPRRSRITTLDDHEPTKDEDFSLFNASIQPSQLMMNGTFFNTEHPMDSSFYLMKSDFDSKNSDSNVFSSPGMDSQFLGLDDFVEDAEDLSDDSDDDNYFQDDNDIDFNDYMINKDAKMAFRNDSTGGTSPSTSVSIDAVKENAHRFDSFDSLPSTVGSDTDLMMVDEAPNAATNASLVHYNTSLHKTPAEISMTNPNHQCELINPTTRKPCNKEFSRPYDLIRHQETIHASMKKIFRCVICEDRMNGGVGNGRLKTFSRGDALSRHIKVKHGLGGQEAVSLINQAKENVEYVSA